MTLSASFNDDLDKFNLVLGLICSAVLLVVSLAIFVLGFFVWKLFPFVKFYFLLQGNYYDYNYDYFLIFFCDSTKALLTLSLAMDLAWWSTELMQASFMDWISARASTMLYILSGFHVRGKIFG